jgi:hypothetical protein
MIAHGAMSVDLPASLFARLAQCVDETLPIGVIQENVLAPVAKVHGVVNGARVPDSKPSSHDEQSSWRPPAAKTQNTWQGGEPTPWPGSQKGRNLKFIPQPSFSL